MLICYSRIIVNIKNIEVLVSLFDFIDLIKYIRYKYDNLFFYRSKVLGIRLI